MFILREFNDVDGKSQSVEQYTFKPFNELGKVVLYKGAKYEWIAYSQTKPYDYILSYYRVDIFNTDKYIVEEIIDDSDDGDSSCFCGLDSVKSNGRHSFYCPKFMR